MSARLPSRKPLKAKREAEARGWLTQAHQDLASAGREREHNYRMACFAAQLAAEKAIKAVLFYEGIPFEFGKRGHDLDALRLKVPKGWQLHEHKESLAALTIWAVERKYPGDLPDATERDVEQCLRAAKSIVEWVTDDLEAQGILPGP